MKMAKRYKLPVIIYISARVVKDIMRTKTWILSEAARGPVGFPEVSGQPQSRPCPQSQGSTPPKWSMIWEPG